MTKSVGEGTMRKERKSKGGREGFWEDELGKEEGRGWGRGIEVLEEGPK